jgi:hypothetical protein
LVVGITNGEAEHFASQARSWYVSYALYTYDVYVLILFPLRQVAVANNTKGQAFSMTEKNNELPREFRRSAHGSRYVARAHKEPFPAFAVRCESGNLETAANAGRRLSVFISQLVRSHGVEQIWDTVIMHCDEDPDGTLTLKVIVSNPDWDERLQIAALRSRPSDPNSLTALACNLDHRRIVP